MLRSEARRSRLQRERRQTGSEARIDWGGLCYALRTSQHYIILLKEDVGDDRR